MEYFLYLRAVIIVEASTGEIHQIEILPVENVDYSALLPERYFFNWKEEQNEEIYKLVISGQKDVLGLISIERIPEEWRIHIRLLCVSRENVGKAKSFENVAGNLIAFVSKIAVAEHAEMACVSLRPKTAIAQHYIDKYKMNRTGTTLSIEVPNILDLINDYEYEK